ncbi:MAG: hypothetical protein ACE5JN_12665 [Candidatus Methylomirabilia bacterium]
MFQFPWTNPRGSSNANQENIILSLMRVLSLVRVGPDPSAADHRRKHFTSSAAAARESIEEGKMAASLIEAMRAKLGDERAILETLARRVDSGPTAIEWQKGYVKALQEICDLEGIPPGMLFIVARDKPALYEYLRDQTPMQVILDRRREERRQRIQAHEPERRQTDRRRQPASEDALRSHGFVVIRRQ